MTIQSHILLTPSAVSYFRKKLAKTGATAIRFGLKDGGCHEKKYLLDCVTGEKAQSEIDCSFENIPIWVDKMALLDVMGTTIDYRIQGLNGQVHYENPNATGTCGCGESFSKKEKINLPS
jgi:iron-sulfur cluster assembly accessory protein